MTTEQRQRTRPALGETVHYVARDGTCRAALVTGHSERPTVMEWVSLHLRVFHLLTTTPELHIEYRNRDQKEPRTWHWGCGRS